MQLDWWCFKMRSAAAADGERCSWVTGALTAVHCSTEQRWLTAVSQCVAYMYCGIPDGRRMNRNAQRWQRRLVLDICASSEVKQELNIEGFLFKQRKLMRCYSYAHTLLHFPAAAHHDTFIGFNQNFQKLRYNASVIKIVIFIWWIKSQAM